MMGYGTGMGPLSWLWMAFALLALTALLVAAIVAGVRMLDRPASAPTAQTPAERSLAERFAVGEITEDEYKGRLEVLRATRR
jgi:putative membrane protein